MAVNGRLTVRGSTGMSMHERFSALRKIPPPAERPQFYEPVPRAPSPPIIRERIRQPRRIPDDYEQEYYEPPVRRPDFRRPRAQSLANNYFDLEDDEHDRLYRVGRGPSLPSRMSARHSRNLAFEAAMRLKHRSIHQRLGVRRQRQSFSNNYNGGYQHQSPFKRYRNRRGRGGGGGRGFFRGMRRSQSYGKLD